MGRLKYIDLWKAQLARLDASSIHHKYLLHSPGHLHLASPCKEPITNDDPNTRREVCVGGFGRDGFSWAGPESKLAVPTNTKTGGAGWAEIQQ